MPPRNPFPYALASFGIAALLEYPLAKKYPLREPVPMVNRMLVAGALAFVGVYAANWLVNRVYAKALPSGGESAAQLP